MSKRCDDCNGRGRWQEEITLADDSVELNWMYCDSCMGTGIEQDPESGDDFDIGGDSYALDQ